MNDIVLSSLVNLFALFSEGSDRNAARSLVEKYFHNVFGVRDYSSYVELFDDLASFYEESPDIDTSKIVRDVATKLSGTLSRSDLGSFALRIMEFCKAVGYGDGKGRALPASLSEGFRISDNSLRKYTDFLLGRSSEEVKVFEPAPGCEIRTLYLKGHNTMLFSYEGSSPVTLNDVPVPENVFQHFQQSAVLKSKAFGSIYFSNLAALYSDVSDVSPVRMSARNVEFRFDAESDGGMHNLSFDLRGGELVAVMGGSGVGKSTLLSLLNGNLQPGSGSITVNGHPISDPAVKSLIGFVPQDDLLIEELTVYENLWFTAKLCFDGMSDSELDSRVLELLRQLGLSAAKDLKVGSPINKYISGGQRKRLNIALELIREPAILFLDEPTSGLSSSDTEKVVGLLKEQTSRGRLIVANIHQPSSDVYKLFDRLWLLDKGGYPIYDGNPIDAVTYFKTAANYADTTSACPECGTVNPEQVLNIIEEPALDATGHVLDSRKVSAVQWHEKYLEGRPSFDSPKEEAVPETSQKRPSAFRQMLIFFGRTLRAKASNLQYILVTALEAPVLALICAVLTRYVPESGVYTLMDNKNLVSYFFMAIIVSIFMGMSGSAEEIIRDRALLKREKFLSLSYRSYIWSKIIFCAAVCLLQTLLFIAVGSPIMGIHGMFFIWWAILFVSAFLAALIGLLLSQCLSSVVTIYITIPLLLIPQILLCGLVVKFDDLTPKSETGNVPIVGDFIPSRWAFEALSTASFRSNPFEREFIEEDRARFQALYYEQAFAYELESQNESLKAEGEEAHPMALEILRKGLPELAEVCGMKPYSGDWQYDSLNDYIESAKKRLSNIGNVTTLNLDRRIGGFVKEYGMDSFKALKADNYNIQLENFVLGRNSSRMYSVVGKSIVPRCGYIFLTPRSKCGRAPFYSGVKVLGNSEIPTPLYNLGVLVLMCIALSILLLFDIPGKYVRKERN